MTKKFIITTFGLLIVSFMAFSSKIYLKIDSGFNFLNGSVYTDGVDSGIKFKSNIVLAVKCNFEHERDNRFVFFSFLI